MMPFPLPLPALDLDSYQIDPEDLDTLRKLQAAIDFQQLILDNLRYSMRKQVEEKYGVDLKKEAWDLDLELGTLSKSG